MQIQLGATYKDCVHGIEGVAVSSHHYLTGCDRVCLEWVKDGETKSEFFDVNRLERVGDSLVTVPTGEDVGGPATAPPSRKAPSR